MTFTARFLSSLRAALPLVLLATGACSGELPASAPLAERDSGGLYARGCPDGRDLEVSFTDEDGELQVRGRCLVPLRPERDEPRREGLPTADRMRPEGEPRHDQLPVADR